LKWTLCVTVTPMCDMSTASSCFYFGFLVITSANNFIRSWQSQYRKHQKPVSYLVVLSDWKRIHTTIQSAWIWSQVTSKIQADWITAWILFQLLGVSFGVSISGNILTILHNYFHLLCMAKPKNQLEAVATLSYLSHITRHTSHHTPCHTSHTSHVTRYMSHISHVTTCHMSQHVTCHKYVTRCHISHSLFWKFSHSYKIFHTVSKQLSLEPYIGRFLCKGVTMDLRYPK